jgi:hexokinase
MQDVKPLATEGRTAQVNVAVTPSEKKAIKLVAAMDTATGRGTVTESDLLYPIVKEIVKRAARIAYVPPEAA